MKRLITCSVAAALFLAAQQAHAQSSQDAAAIAGGVLGGLGLWAQTRTTSTLDVRVEVFRETEALPLPPDLRYELSPRKTRSQPFRLDKRTAASQYLTDDAITAPSATVLLNIQSQIAPILPRLHRVSGEMSLIISSLESARTTDTNWNAVYADFRRLGDHLSNALAAGEAFVNSVDSAGADGTYTAGELDSAADRLAVFREKTADFDTIESLKSDSLGLIARQLGRSVGVQEWADLASAIESAAPPTSYARQMAILLETFRDSIPASLTPDQQAAAENALNRCGVMLTIPELQALPTIPAIENRLLQGALIAETARQEMVIAHAATYGSGTSSPNLGPIVNEVMQAVLTQSEYIDIITDKANEDKWVVLNSAHSKARMGDHNTVIYLENMATPVIKSAKFDPTAFIQANAVLYQKAFDTSATLFGLPVGQNADDPLKDANLMSIERKMRELKRVKRQNRLKLIEKIGNLITTSQKGDGAADDGT